MFNIDFSYSNDKIKVDFKLLEATDNILYILSDDKKIFIHYTRKNIVTFPKNIILNKKVRFQLYWKNNGIAKSFKSKEIFF